MRVDGCKGGDRRGAGLGGRVGGCGCARGHELSLRRTFDKVCLWRPASRFGCGRGPVGLEFMGWDRDTDASIQG